MGTDCPHQIAFLGDLFEILDFASSCPGKIMHFAAAALLIGNLPILIETSSPPPASLHHVASAFPATLLACLPYPVGIAWPQSLYLSSVPLWQQMYLLPFFFLLDGTSTSS